MGQPMKILEQGWRAYYVIMNGEDALQDSFEGSEYVSGLLRDIYGLPSDIQGLHGNIHGLHGDIHGLIYGIYVKGGGIGRRILMASLRN